MWAGQRGGARAGGGAVAALRDMTGDVTQSDGGGTALLGELTSHLETEVMEVTVTGVT